MQSTHFIRTLRIPVAEIVSGTKQDFYRDLRQSVDLATKTANRVLSLCMAADQAAYESLASAVHASLGLSRAIQREAKEGYGRIVVENNKGKQKTLIGQPLINGK